MTPLQRLIRNRMADLNLTYSELARRGGLSTSSVHALAHKERKSPPRVATLTGLATGMQVPLQVVKHAAAESSGLVVQSNSDKSDPDLSIVATCMTGMAEDDRRFLVRMAQRLHDRGAADA